MALLGVSQPAGHAMRVSQEECGRIDQHSTILRGFDRESPEDRWRERLGHGLAL